MIDLAKGQRVRVHSYSWTPDGWAPKVDEATVINPCVTGDSVYAGDVEVSIEGVLNRCFYGRSNIELIDAQPNPFIGLRPETHQVIEAMLYDLRASSDDGDQVATWIDQWRAGRGEAGMADWRWWIGEVDGEAYVLDFATRDEAVAAAPRAIRSGDFASTDGRFWICRARCWNDNLNEGDDVFPFAVQTIPEIESIAPGGGHD